MGIKDIYKLTRNIYLSLSERLRETLNPGKEGGWMDAFKNRPHSAIEESLHDGTFGRRWVPFLWRELEENRPGE